MAYSYRQSSLVYYTLLSLKSLREIQDVAWVWKYRCVIVIVIVKGRI